MKNKRERKGTLQKRAQTVNIYELTNKVLAAKETFLFAAELQGVWVWTVPQRGGVETVLRQESAQFRINYVLANFSLFMECTWCTKRWWKMGCRCSSTSRTSPQMAGFKDSVTEGPFLCPGSSKFYSFHGHWCVSSMHFNFPQFCAHNWQWHMACSLV